jgi:hypothetical protein
MLRNRTCLTLIVCSVCYRKHGHRCPAGSTGDSRHYHGLGGFRMQEEAKVYLYF